MRERIGIRNVYLLLIVIIGLIGLSVYSTYALFTDSLETNEIVSLTAIDLNIDVINVETYKQVELSPYERKTILIKLNNSTDILKYYKIWYQMIDPSEKNDYITISKLEESFNNTSGTIGENNTLEIKLIITNFTQNNTKINLGVLTSDNNNIILDNNKLEVFEIATNNNDNQIYSTSFGDFPAGQCTKFSSNNINGVYQIELWGSNGSYVAGNIFLDSAKALYICVGKENYGTGITDIRIDKPENEWYLNSNLLTKIMMTGNEKINSFILTRQSYNDLKNNNITYNLKNAKEYYLSKTKIVNDNVPDKGIINNDGFAKITLVLPYKDTSVKNLNIGKVYVNNSLASYPSNGDYNLIGYSCSTIKSGLNWNNKKYTITYPYNISEEEICDLYFSSEVKKLLTTAKIGDYVKYVGVGGTTSNGKVSCTTTKECIGESISCSGEDNYNSSGWRIAYIGVSSDKELTSYLISAGATECSNSSSIEELNDLAIKYCNNDYVYGGSCDTTINSVWLWTLNWDDYNKILNYGNNINNCNKLNYNDSSCGFKNELLDNGGTYTIINGENVYSWKDTGYGIVSNDKSLKGVRPIIRLKQNITIISGSGTEKDPYVINN